MQKIALFWFRRDLRLEDNAGLYHALKSGFPVLPLFIFDRNILDDLEDRKDARVTFIHQEVNRIKSELEELGSTLLIKHGKPQECWKEILNNYNVGTVFTNRDYEPYAKDRDFAIQQLLEKKDIPFHTYKDHVIFEKQEVVKKAGGIYTVFTPYSRTWKARLASQIDKMEDSDGNSTEISFFLKPYPNEKYYSNFHKRSALPSISLKDMDFQPSNIEFPPRAVKRSLIKNYNKTRNFPAQEGTSRLGIHFRFGTISIRQKAWRAAQLNETYLNELIWRDFYAMILDNFPKVTDTSFREKYDDIEWRNNEKEFELWCQGKTGYPIVDAGIRELNATGYMHNRVRMITASFLTKHLLIDWRWGEAYFAKKLLDYDLASNNGGWQWAAGSGTDAAPYFRIFNPASQMEKFDKEKKYIKQWVSEYGTDEYPNPIVDHKEARERCLEVYKKAL